MRLRWVVFTLIVIMALPSCVLLSNWQYHRWLAKRAYNAQVELNSQLPGLSNPKSGDPTERQWRNVALSGTWLPQTQRFIRMRTLNAQNGFWVTQSLQLTDQSVVIVVRGWVAATGNARSTPTITPATGTQSITARLRVLPPETRPRPTDLPQSQSDEIDAKEFGATVTDRYFEQTQASAGLTALPLPHLTEWTHLSYAVQWILIGLALLAGYVYLMRSDIKSHASA